VLVVDDDPANLMVVEAALVPSGYTVVTAGSAEDARAMMLATQPRMVLLDVMMPGESGTQACRTWRESAQWDHVPIVLLTALLASDHRSTGLAAGADDFLEKPIDLDELLRTVARWTATGRQPRTLPAVNSISAELRSAMNRLAKGAV
jgi:DNA-binding response OmpR family regulator